MGDGGAAPADPALKAACEACGAASELYGTACHHATLCRSCGAAMARTRGRCAVCAAPVTTLIREYTVRVDTAAKKAYSIGRFSSGLPPLSKRRSAGSRWSLRKEGPQGQQLTGNMREKYYSKKPWILEDETGEYQYQGHTEGSQSMTATYYLLKMHGKEFNAVPVGSWYNFSKIAQYKQLTLEEAEEKMNKRRSSASGYERWMMKVAANGAAAFSSDVKRLDNVNGGPTGGVHPRKGDMNEDGDQSDKGEEDKEGETARKNSNGLTTKAMEDDDEEGEKDRDFDLEDEIEKGDDWEHEEIFTDDDEALDIDTEERPDLADPEAAPPEIKQDDNENEHGDGGSSNLSKSGQELKKLLRQAARMESDEDVKDTDEDSPPLPVHGPKEIVQPKSGPENNKPAKPTPQHAQNITPAFKSTQKRKPGGDDISHSAASKKMKTKLETKTSVVNVETQSLEPASGTSLSARDTNSGPITEKEIRTVLAVAPITSQDLVSKFKSRLQTREEKREFVAILTKISHIRKTKGGSYIVLREQYK